MKKNERAQPIAWRNPYPLAIYLGLHGMAEKHGFSYDFRDNLSKMSTITVLDQCFSKQNCNTVACNALFVPLMISDYIHHIQLISQL